MSKHTCFLLIVFFSLLGLAAAGAGAGQTPVIHENPASLTTQQPFDVNGKLMLQLEQMFGSLDNTVMHINASDFQASRLSMRDFDLYYSFFKDYLGRINLTGSDYQRILGQADLTANDLRTMINSSEGFDTAIASFERHWATGDMVSATREAVELQGYFNTMNVSSQQLTASASVIGRLLQNTSVNTNDLERGIDTLDVFMRKVELLNQQPKSLLGNTNLTLNASQTNVSTGDTVMFYARLSSNNTTIGGGLICLYLDDEPVANVTTAADGTCFIYHIIRGGSFAGTINATAYYDPQGANYTPAVSNKVELKRRPFTPDLTLDMTPMTARFGDIVSLSGRLVTDDGYPVPDHLVSIYFSGQPGCFAKTFENGSYYCDMYITPQIRSGMLDVLAMYDAGNAPDDALTNATSPPATLYVVQESTSLTLDMPPPVLRGGDNVSFTGTLKSASGLPVEGEAVSIYADSICLGSNYTDGTGRYGFHTTIPYNMSAGTYQVYTAYNVTDGMSLSGSRSQEYSVTLAAAPPTIVVNGIPLIAFQGDKLDLLVTVTANHTPVDGCGLIVNMSDLTLGSGYTNLSGNLSLVYLINGSAGLQTVKVYSASGGLLESAAVDTGIMLVMPFDMMTSLAIIVVILAVLGLVIARITKARRMVSRMLTRKTPLPKPTLKVTPLPEPPAGWGIRPGPTRFEDEVTRINTIIAGGADNREVIVEIYLAARRITGAHGFAIAESATHREFYRKLIAQEPRLNVSAGTITRHYESAVFGHKSLSEKDIVGSLYSLKEINTLTAGEPAGGSASTGGGT